MILVAWLLIGVLFWSLFVGLGLQFAPVEYGWSSPPPAVSYGHARRLHDSARPRLRVIRGGATPGRAYTRIFHPELRRAS